ncbi:ammonia-dependent NAD(+) synthetase, partial [Dermatophilus congolensis]
MNNKELQQHIINELHVTNPATFDPAEQAEKRITFLTDYLKHTQARGYVLGISGGIDSTLAGCLCQLAVERTRNTGTDATFIAMRLPYNTQADEPDAQDALTFINPDQTLTVDIAPATDAMWNTCTQAGMTQPTNPHFIRGNIKARQRMIAQYTIAAARNMLVIGTDHAAEALVGFYTKHGDGACDLTPLAGLPKRRVRQIAHHLGAPEHIINKTPTADLETDKPLHPDETALGVTYDQIDDYLEGHTITPHAETTITNWYTRTAHKRALPATPT